MCPPRAVRAPAVDGGAPGARPRRYRRHVRFVAPVATVLVGGLWLVMTIALAVDEMTAFPRRAVAGSIVLAALFSGLALLILRRTRLLGDRPAAAIAVAATVGLIASAPVALE